VPVSFHIGILPDRPVAEVAELACFAEERGIEGVWVADSQSIFRDAYAALALCAARTERMTIATGVTNPVTRHPAVLAGAFATLDELSGGRAVIGIGVGESAVATLGLPKARLSELERVTHVLRALTAGETANWEGRELRITWPRRAVPIVFASSGPKSLRLGGRIADGVLFQVGSTPAAVRYALRNIDAGVEEAEREPSTLRRFVRLACALDDDGGRAREEIKGYAAAAAGTVFANLPRADIDDGVWHALETMKAGYDYYEHASQAASHGRLLTDRVIDAIAIAGTPEEAVPRFRELIACGVDGFVIPATTSDPYGFVRMLTERVIPHLDGA